MNTMSANTIEADAATGLPAYPLSILIGCAALDESNAFNQMPDGFWRIVSRLVKKISVATPFQPIFARRDTIARESGKSLETVGRALRWLEDELFITRQQKARAGLRGSSALIYPTEKFIRALGIGQTRRQKTVSNIHSEKSRGITKGVDRNEVPSDLSTISSVKNDGSVSALQVHSLINKRQSYETVANTKQKIETPTGGTERKNVVIDGKIIPEELSWIAKDCGVPATGVLCLMKLARKAGQRLSDIVACCKPMLTSLRGNSLFAYLRKLIGQDKDYTGIVRKAEDTAEKQHQQKQDEALVERKKLEWQGQRFVSRDQARTWTVDASGFILLNDSVGSKCSARRMDKDFVEAVMNGDLRRLVA